jgi:hypothetical protein
MELRELTNMFKCEYAHSACDGLGWIIPFLSLADARGTATTVLSLILSVVLVPKLSHLVQNWV